MTDTRSESGFSLVELIVATGLLGIILTALAASIVVGLTTTPETTQRFSESHDAQLVSAYLANDVQSAKAITASSCGAGPALVSFSFDGGREIASYHAAAAGAGTTLVRRYCNPSGALADEDVLAHVGGPAPPTAACDDTGCDPAARPSPDLVSISVVEQSGYQFTATGARRAYAAGAPGPARASGVVAGLGLGTERQLTITGNGRLHVLGNLYLDCCGGSPQLPAPNLVTMEGTNARLDVDGAFGIYGYPSLGGCAGCDASKVSAWPPIALTTHITDPYADLPYPDVTREQVYTDGIYHGPGVYRTLPLAISGGDVTLAPGIYILEEGIVISGRGNQGTHVSGTGVILFNGCGGNAPPSCSNTGSISLSGGASMTIEPPSSGPYRGVAVFQHRTNTATITLSGGSQATSLGGTLYAPGATQGVSLGAGGAELRIKGVVATAIQIVGNGVVTVG